MPKQTPDSAHALGSGLTFGVVVALFALGGLWLDQTLGTKPWGLLLGIMLGLLGGTIHLLGSLAPGVLPFGRRSRKGDRNRVDVSGVDLSRTGSSRHVSSSADSSSADSSSDDSSSDSDQRPPPQPPSR